MEKKANFVTRKPGLNSLRAIMLAFAIAATVAAMIEGLVPRSVDIPALGVEILFSALFWTMFLSTSRKVCEWRISRLIFNIALRLFQGAAILVGVAIIVFVFMAFFQIIHMAAVTTGVVEHLGAMILEVFSIAAAGVAISLVALWCTPSVFSFQLMTMNEEARHEDEHHVKIIKMTPLD